MNSPAEREGFEPSTACTVHDFQSCALDQLCDLSELLEGIIPIVAGGLQIGEQKEGLLPNRIQCV